MRRISGIDTIAPIALLLCGSALPAQSIWDSSVRIAPQFQAYNIKAPFNEKITEFSLPMFYSVPVTSVLTLDVGTAFASAHLERQTDSAGVVQTTTSDMSGLTDTQVRANYTFGQDLLVLTAGVNIPTGSATVDADKLDAATRIGSDFLTFPTSGFGSGLGFTGGVAVAQPMGAWNLGFGASVRQSMEYEPFRNGAGTSTKYQPGLEIRARAGLDHPFGTGRISFGFSYSKFGDDKANTATFNSGDRLVGQFAVNSSLTNSVDYSFVAWNLYRTEGTLIDNSVSPGGNITNALFTLGMRGPSQIGIEPSVETRFWSQEGSTSYQGTLGMRFIVNRGSWALVPGFGYTIGSMDEASLTGYRAALGIRWGT
ncbi:MAG TPA: hypothetical protein VFT29_10375 [Gemmatimonadaceae bacterium]|nr:hypothetical protein [Gemmatimonadaceae bacterium]